MTFVRNFDGAQVFYVDPSAVDSAPTCDISAINLYFKFKPDLALNLNDTTTGAYVTIVPTKYGVPSITRDSGLFTGHIARASYNDITTSSDASVPTEFRFERPFTVETDKEYAFLFSFDASAQYVLWESKLGDVLTGTTEISPGPSSKFIGRYYNFTTVFAADETTDLDEYLKNWRPINDTSVKFDIKIARYAHNGIPVSGNSTIQANDTLTTTVLRPNAVIESNNTSTNTGFNINFNSYEYITYDFDKSTESLFVGGQLFYQNTVYYPGGWNNSNSFISIVTQSGNNKIAANTLLPNGQSFQWSTLFPTVTDARRIVLTDGTTTNIRTITDIVSNTIVTLDESLTFSNTNAKMMITPVGRAHHFDSTSPFGVRTSILTLSNSSANSTVRFVNNTIQESTIVGGGSGYSNNDVLYVKGFEDVTYKVTGGYVAVANLVTNSTGGITTLHFSNLGCGFVNTAAITTVIANSTSIGNTTSNTSAGSSASITYQTGAIIKAQQGGTTLYDCVVRNVDLAEFIPFYRIDGNFKQTDYKFRLESNYVRQQDTSVLSSEVFYVNDGTSNNQLDLVMYDINSTEGLSETPAVMSRSNEFVTVYEDGSPNDKHTSQQSLSSESLKLVVDLDYANSDYNTLRLYEPVISFRKFIINNDATNEHTDFGNAFSKGITKTYNFDRTAEDIRLFVTAYKPANTDIKLYARIYKNEDPDAFDDKNWTELELKDGSGSLSSDTNADDYRQYEYGFYQVPQDRTALDGTITIASGDANVTGVGTSFSSDLSVGDLVYLYQPLFVDNHMVVSVTAIANDTQFTMDTSTTNTSLLAEGMKIEKITYPLQAFNNKQNDNIVRYYNGSFSNFDGYETVAVKIVMLSDSPHRIPNIDSIEGTGVSA